ncbi:MAG: acyl-CoA dehydrogenase family protein [candidate division Zixibacteria bacterium]|jgi:butyryl-CoA dehydrogenase|nr:acyl-CoA dehydrogenase family protein [candidate division Zixibacteria bacterium]
MSRNIDPRQQAVRDEVKAFAEKHMYPVSRQLDEMPEPRKFPRDLYKKIGDAGFIGYAMPKELGGRGKSKLEYITLIEELCYHDAAIGLLCAVAELATYPIVHFASDEQKKKWVPKCASGEVIPAFVLTEPEAGSDAANQKTVAVENGDNYVVNGEKIFIMHGDVAELGVLFCKIEGQPKLSAMLVDTNQPGWNARTLRNKMGMRAATTGGIVLKDVKTPKANLLGEVGKGFRYAMQTLDSARIGVAAQGVGIAQRALDESVAYAKKRQAFGQPIAKLQAIQWMIADMATRLEAARSLTYKAVQLQDAGEKFGLEASMAKLFASEVANFCVDRAMQIHGGYGFIGEFTQIEKLYRDQRVLEIYEGTSEVQRLVIAGNVIGR